MVYDILIKNGYILDPDKLINGEYDILIKGNKIVKIERKIENVISEDTIDASGCYISPGWIDMHCHIYPSYPFQEDQLPTIHGDAHMFASGVTTAVDAGTCGSRDFIKFKEDVIDNSKLRIYAFINIASGGMVNLSSEQKKEKFHPEIIAAMARTFDKEIVGFKTAHYRTHEPFNEYFPEWESVDQVIQASELANKPVMFDFFPNRTRTYEKLLLEKMRAGDIHTHMYASQFDIIEEKKVKNFISQARDKGILFDLGHGAGSFDYRNAVYSIENGHVPDVISTDLYFSNVNGQAINLSHVMSKLLCMGISVEDAIYKVTKAPACIIGHKELGCIKEEGIADLTIFKVNSGSFSYGDSNNTRINGNKKIECIMTILDGELVYNPYALNMTLFDENHGGNNVV